LGLATISTPSTLGLVTTPGPSVHARPKHHGSRNYARSKPFKSGILGLAGMINSYYVDLAKISLFDLSIVVTFFNYNIKLIELIGSGQINDPSVIFFSLS